MIKKLFDVTDNPAAPVIVAHLDSVPRAGSLFGITHSDNDPAVIAVDLETSRDFNRERQSALVVDAIALSVKGTVEEPPANLVVDSMTALVDEDRTVDAIPASVKLKGFLSTKTSKHRVVLEDTKFFPSALVMLSGKKFKEAYRKQLIAIIYEGHQNGNADDIISLTRMFDVLNNTQGNVQLCSSKFKRKLNDIVQVLNALFLSQYVVLDGIVSMVKGGVAENKPQDVVDTKMADVSRHYDPPTAKSVEKAPEEDIFEYPTR